MKFRFGVGLGFEIILDWYKDWYCNWDWDKDFFLLELIFELSFEIVSGFELGLGVE